VLAATLLDWAPAPPAWSRPADDLDAFVASLEGGWAGQDNVTPMGTMPFAVLFERQEDGGLHSHSALNRETFIDLRFAKDERGRWILHERAGLEGSGVQAYSLAPAGLAGGLRRWAYEPDPEFLTIDVGVEGDTMSMNVRLRGRDHVQFKLARLPEAAVPELKRQMTLAAGRSPQEVSIAQAVGRSPRTEAADPVAAARRAVTENPADGRARLKLARALGAEIRRDSAANGPRYAFEMLEALQKAVELDPRLVEAYHWLAGYYLEAPPIAGGSLDKAEEVARRLAELDPESARALRSRIEARRSGGK
jgi:hypothetical protein